MSNYIISRYNEVGSIFPTRLAGNKVDAYDIISLEPNISNYIDVNLTTGELIFTGYSSPVVSEVLVNGTNVAGEYTSTLYVITPYELPYGSISAGTSTDISLPYYGSPITIEFTSGGTVTELGGGYFTIIPIDQDEFAQGTTLTGNVITSDYYISNSVAYYTFQNSGISITYPITVGLPIENISEDSFNSLKTFQVSGNSVIELPSTLGTYDSIAKTGYTLVEISSTAQIISVPSNSASRPWCTAVEVYTGLSLNQVSNNYYNDNLAAKTTIYVYTINQISTEDQLLTFWTQTMGWNSDYSCNSMTFYSDCSGTLLNVPTYVTINTLSTGIYVMYKGWFVQLEQCCGNVGPRLIRSEAFRGKLDGQLSRRSPTCQPARQVIPVSVGNTIEEACSEVKCLYLFNDTKSYNEARCVKTQNYAQLFYNGSSGSTLNVGVDVFPPNVLYRRGGSTTSAQLYSTFFPGYGGPWIKLGCGSKTVTLPSNVSPGPYQIGKVFSATTSTGLINSLPFDCPQPTPTPTTTTTPTLTQTLSETPTNTPTLTQTLSETPTNTPTLTQTLSETPTNTPTLTQTLSETPTNTPTLTQTLSETPTNTPTLTQTLSETPTNTPTLTQTLSETPTNTPTLTQTLSETPTNTPTLTQTLSETPTNTPTLTQTLSETPTNTPTLTQTLSETPTNTPTLTQTVTQTLSETPTNTPTLTETPTLTSTVGTSSPPTPTPTTTPTLTETPTLTQTLSETPTNTPTLTQTVTQTLTQTLSETPTNTPTLTQTVTQTLSETPTNTPTLTQTVTQTLSETPTNTPTLTQTVTQTLSQTPTITPTVSEGYCTGCTNYDLVISQSDLDAHPTGKVYVYYSGCTVTDGEIEDVYSFSGTYRNALCADNCTTIKIWLDTTGTPATSSYVTATSDCTPVGYTCNNTYNITVTEETTYFNPFIEFEDTNYGNLNVTITMTGGNDINQFYLGNQGTGYGAIFNFDSTGGTQTQYFGFWNVMSNLIEFGVYSVNTGTTTFQPFTFTINVACPDLIPCSGNTTTDCYECFDYTFVSAENQNMYWYKCDGTSVVSAVTEGEIVNIVCARECSVVGNGTLSTSTSCGYTGTDCTFENPTINVTSIGWIKYTDSFGNQQYEYVSSTGVYTINGCVNCSTIAAGTPYGQVASFDSPVCTTYCEPLNNYTSQLISVVPQTESTSVCTLTSPNTVYTNYTATTMSNGVTFYSNKQLTTVFNGGNNWYRVVWKGSVDYDTPFTVRINNSGVVQDYINCNTPLPVYGLYWFTTVDNPCNPNPWVISNYNQTIRYNVADSSDCGGTCNATQAGTATANITVGASPVWLGIDFEGIGELQASNYEILTLSLDGNTIADAHAAGGNLGCTSGPVVKNYDVSPPYYLAANSNHTFYLDFTTNDPLYNLNSYYEINLSFSTTGSFTGNTSIPYVASGDACNASLTITTLGDGPTMCQSNVLYNSTFGSYSTNNYFISDGTNVIQVKITNGNNNAVVLNTCLSCPQP